MSQSPGSHSGPYGAAVMMFGFIISGNSESSVKYIAESFHIAATGVANRGRENANSSGSLRGMAFVRRLRHQGKP
jgi:hypothetical protein